MILPDGLDHRSVLYGIEMELSSTSRGQTLAHFMLQQDDVGVAAVYK